MSQASAFKNSAAGQLLIYALYVCAAMAVLLYLLSLGVKNTAGSASNGAINVEDNSITIAIRQEPAQLDSSRATDGASAVVFAHVMEGLIAYDNEDNLVPAIAERWEITAQGATFYLRDNARWSDGQPITAHDFVYAWRKVVDPATAAQYSLIMYSVKNGEAINQGSLPKETLGVVAKSDRVLVIEFENPTPHFDKLVPFYTFFPIREDFFEATNGGYGTEADLLLYSGPYKIAQWTHSSTMSWEKNPHYWDDNKGFLDAIHVAYITDDVNSRLNLFKDGQITDTHLLPSMLGNAMEQHWQIDRTMDGTVFFLEFNHRDDRVSRNLNFRKALQLAQDPEEFVYKAMKEPAYLPGVSLFPIWVPGITELFRQEYPPIAHQQNIIKAQQHLEMARVELGLDEFPPIVLLIDDNEAGKVTGEYYQEVYRRVLGLEILLDKQIFKQRLDKMTSGDFDFYLGGWSPDYFDALTYAELFASWNLNNRGRYVSAEMDALVRLGQTSLNPQERMDAFGEIQRLAYEDVAMIPVYERGWSFVVDPRLKGFKRRVVGPEVDYKYAYIELSDEVSDD